MMNLYDMETFATNEGPQEQALLAMIHRLLEPINNTIDYHANNFYGLLKAKEGGRGGRGGDRRSSATKNAGVIAGFLFATVTAYLI